jgi:Mg2+ and Co2+ transporter CorA
VEINCLALEPGGGLTPVPHAEALSRWQDGGGPYWIHLGGGPFDAVVEWISRLGLDPTLVSLIKAGPEETRILPLPGATFVAYPIPGVDGSRDHSHFGFLCLERLMVTVHRETDATARLEEALAKGVVLREASTAGVFCALLLVHATRLRKRVVTLRAEGEALADRMDIDPSAVRQDEILGLKRRVSALATVVDEELAVLEVLKVSNRNELPIHRLADVFSVGIEIARATDRDIDRLDLRLNDLRQRYETAQQELTNRRLGVLTMLSAIFMPLTLISGIYGMNFVHMPELQWRHGYPLALLGMLCIAGTLTWYFRSRWWTKNPRGGPRR